MTENLEKDSLTKAQHYIPRFYLKYFENQRHLIERLDVRENMILSPKGKKGLCFEDFFYGLETGKEDEVSQIVEKLFKIEEDHISDYMPRIIDNLLSSSPVTFEHKYVLSRFMAMLYLRSPRLRSSLNSMITSGLKQLKEILSNYPEEVFEKVLKENFGNTLSSKEIEKVVKDEIVEPHYNNSMHLKMITELKGFSNMLFGQEWLVYRNKTEIPFVTSDNPISPEPFERKGIFGGGFMELTYHFALSPDIHIQTQFPKEKSKKVLHRKTINTEDEALRLNLFIADACTKEVYSDVKTSLNQISTIIEYARNVSNKN